MSNDLSTLFYLIEKRAKLSGKDASKGTQVVYLESVIKNILESGDAPEKVIQRWIKTISSSL